MTTPCTAAGTGWARSGRLPSAGVLCIISWLARLITRGLAGPLWSVPVAIEGRSAPVPTEITLHQVSRLLEIAFSDGAVFKLSCELLRVYSPSAEVRGHGPGQEVLQTGKRDVQITAIEPVGTYAVKLVFSDGHDTGLYAWDTLYELGRDQEQLWRRR